MATVDAGADVKCIHESAVPGDAWDADSQGVTGTYMHGAASDPGAKGVGGVANAMGLGPRVAGDGAGAARAGLDATPGALGAHQKHD